MAVYWFLISYFALGALNEGKKRPGAAASSPLLLLGGLLITLLVGLRYDVGADWTAYEFMFSYAQYVDLGRSLEIGDPGYQLLNWGVQNLGGELWFVNLVCSLIFTWGLIRFSLGQTNPWLAVLVAIPYLVIVVAMGYSRQAVALGILMGGLASFKSRGSVLQFALYVGAAALFHKTAVIVFPLVAFASHRNRTINVLVAISTSLMFYDLFLGDSMAQFVKNYIETEYSSQGAAIRVVMSLIPAIIFFFYRRRLAVSEQDYLLWRNFSLAAAACLILLFTLPSSTAVDRIALYTIPLQVAVLSRVPGFVMAHASGKLVIIIYSIAVQFVWLNYAAHSEYWIPYQFYPFS